MSHKRNAWEDGKKAFDSQNYEEAFMCFSEIIGSDSKNNKAFTKRGLTFIGMHEYTKALYDFSCAV
jgi:hypothetical protein